MKGGVCRDYLDWSGEIDLGVTSLSGGYMSSGGLPPQVNEYSQGCLGDLVYFVVYLQEFLMRWYTCLGSDKG